MRILLKLNVTRYSHLCIGHTTEILKLLSLSQSTINERLELFHPKVSSRTYVLATTDSNSEFKARSFEDNLQNLINSSSKPSSSSKYRKKSARDSTMGETLDLTDNNPFQLCRIPRSRHVHQSWFSTPFTTVYSFVFCFALVWRERPDVLLCNGPGTCIPLCISAWILNLFRFMRCKLIFVESFARVKNLSLSGKIMYRLADKFMIHWPALLKRYPKAEYIGKLL